MTILVLEDNKILAEGICVKLKCAGFFIDHFSDGADGLFRLLNFIFLSQKLQ